MSHIFIYYTNNYIYNHCMHKVIAVRTYNRYMYVDYIWQKMSGPSTLHRPVLLLVAMTSRARVKIDSLSGFSTPCNWWQGEPIFWLEVAVTNGTVEQHWTAPQPSAAAASSRCPLPPTPPLTSSYPKESQCDSTHHQCRDARTYSAPRHHLSSTRPFQETRNGKKLQRVLHQESLLSWVLA